MGITKSSENGWAATTRIGLIGAGPTGTVLLERFVTLALQCPDRRFEILVCDPNLPGVGLHDPDQPKLLPLNTPAAQIGVLSGRNGISGPTLYEWLSEGPQADNIQPWDYVPRRECGAYLAAMFSRIRSNAPDNVAITVLPARIERVVPQITGGGYLLKSGDGTSARVDQLCLCEGHIARLSRSTTTGRAGLIEHCYPLPETVSGIAPGETVAVEGMGLAASDVLTMLTRGRGGRHERTSGRCRYVASGREPVIWLCSRSGMPFHARPFAPLAYERRRPLVLTRAHIDRLRAETPRLDFAAQILPLLKLEMSAAFHETRAAMEGPQAARTLRVKLLSLITPDDLTGELLRAELDLLDNQDGRFSADQAFLRLPPAAALENYADWVRKLLVADIAEAELGLMMSPAKAALEVCRDLRDTLRHAVDFDGLTATSHLEFYRDYAPLFNRLVGGPTIERTRELVALLDAGVVRLPRGPVASIEPLRSRGFRLRHRNPRYDASSPVRVDRVVKAYGISSGVIATASGPMRALHHSGHLTTVRSIPGLDGVRVDPHSRPIDRNGRPVGDLALLGPATEGARYYNHYIATPGISRVRRDADLIARRMMGLAAFAGPGRDSDGQEKKQTSG